MNGTVLANRSAIDRSKTDFYATPPEVTAALLDFLHSNGLLKHDHVIWEPACGDMKMVTVMMRHGYEVIPTDLYNPIPNLPGLDFLTANVRCDWIITNPPFSKATEFIRHALDIEKPCAFLLESQFWHAQSMVQLFRDNPPSYVLPLTWRPDFLYGAKSGSPTMEVLWTVWAGDHDTKYWPLTKVEVRSDG